MILGGKAIAFKTSRIFGAVRSEFRRRRRAVAVRAFNGGRHWEAEDGVRMGVRNAAEGCGRF